MVQDEDIYTSPLDLTWPSGKGETSGSAVRQGRELLLFISNKNTTLINNANRRFP